MNYHSSIKKTKRDSKTFFLFFFIVIFGLVVFTPLSSLFHTITARLKTSNLSYTVISFFSSKSALLREKEALLKKNAELILISLERDILLAENLELKKNTETHTSSKAVAKVLLHPGFSPFDTFIIGRGKDAGIELGDLVRSHGLILGEISEVKERTSRVTLFSSSGNTFPVTIGKQHFEVEAKGLGGGTFETLLPKNIEIELGDTAVFAFNTPRLLGTVQEIEIDKNGIFKKVLFSLPININNIEFVTIEQKDL